MKFGGQTSKNVYDVRKVCLETTLRVYVCFIVFDVFVLHETHVLGLKHVYDNIWVGNVHVRIHIGPTRGPKGEPLLELNTARQCQTTTQMKASRPGDGPSMGGIDGDTWPVCWGVEGETTIPHWRGVGETRDRRCWVLIVLFVSFQFCVSYKMWWRLFWVFMGILRVYKSLYSYYNPNTYIKTLSIPKFLQKPP